MSWNEPGGGKKDPWSGKASNDDMPELDEAIKALQSKLEKIFGNGSNHKGENGDGFSGNSLKGLAMLAAGAVIVWGLSGFYIVDEGNHGVETRFGKYSATTQAGLNWHLPSPIENVMLVNVKQQRFIEVGYRTNGSDLVAGGSVPKEALMLTRDENYVDVRLAVQYQVKNARAFLFSLANPVATLKHVTESAERGVIGGSDMDFVLTEGRSEIVSQIKKEIQDTMDNYNSGIQITSVNLQDAQPPEQVQNAFADAIKAREDQQRLINEAQAYSNDVVPKARGAAARKIQEAEGYKEQVIAQAQGETSRFSQLLTEYAKSPEVTRKRLYIDAMESVLSNANSVIVDVKNSNNMMYLPLDKLISQSTQNVKSDAVNTQHASPANTEPVMSAPTTSNSPISVPSLEHPSLRGRQNDMRGR